MNRIDDSPDALPRSHRRCLVLHFQLEVGQTRRLLKIVRQLLYWRQSNDSSRLSDEASVTLKVFQAFPTGGPRVDHRRMAQYYARHLRSFPDDAHLADSRVQAAALFEFLGQILHALAGSVEQGPLTETTFKRLRRSLNRWRRELCRLNRQLDELEMIEAERENALMRQLWEDALKSR